MTDTTWHSVPLTLEHVRGALRLEPTERGVAPHRLPVWAVEQAADPQLAMVEAQGAGVRVVLRTAATTVELVARPLVPTGAWTSSSTARWSPASGRPVAARPSSTW